MGESTKSPCTSEETCEGMGSHRLRLVGHAAGRAGRRTPLALRRGGIQGEPLIDSHAVQYRMP